MDKDMVSILGYIKTSEYRKKTLLELTKGYRIPSEIAKATDIRVTHISRTLKHLKEKGLVKCLNEEDKRGRVYKLTEKGNKIVENL
jgi:DNA-binding MarR family transcriptional regulator